MKNTLLTAGIAMTILASAPAQAWNQTTHRRIAEDAVTYMERHPTTTNYAKLLTGVTRAGLTMDQFKKILGQGAFDVDAFEDTFICGAVTGLCRLAPVDLTSVAHYTSFWHFQDRTAGRDVHGNSFGGYNYTKLANRGDIDEAAALFLWNDYLDDGASGLRGIFGDSTRYNTYGVTEAHYRLGGYSTRAMYQDFQTMPFQPIDNLGQYWWGQFLLRPTAQTLGFVLHTTDILQPHHTWGMLGKNHASWESWVEDYYDSYQLNDPALVTMALSDGVLTALPAAETEIRGLLDQAGNYSYNNGSIVLSSSANFDRLTVAKKTVPHSIALAVIILNRAAERLVK